MKIKHLPKKAMAMMLSLLFVLTAFAAIPMTANAATEEINVSIILYPRGGGTTSWGHPNLDLMNGWEMHESRLWSAMSASNKGNIADYCVQPAVSLSTGDTEPIILPENFLETYDNELLNHKDIVELIGRIFQYGWTGTITVSMTDEEITEQIATQLLVWETTIGECDVDFNHIAPTGGKNSVAQAIKPEHPLPSMIFAHYNRIVSSVQAHSEIPSFIKKSTLSASTYEMVWDGSKYSVTLTDSNNVLNNFTFSANVSGVNFYKQGNKLTVSTTTLPAADIQITASKSSSNRHAIAFWCSNKIKVKGKMQGLVMSGMEISDPIHAYLKVKVSTGTLNIIKTTKNSDGKIGGFSFRLSKDGANIGVYTSADDGKVSIPNLAAGWYRVEEINLSDNFVKPTPNPVEVDIKARFLTAFSRLMESRNELIEDCRLAQSVFCDATAIDAELAELRNEIEVVTELSRKAICENARTAVNQTERAERNNAYLDRHRRASERVNELEAAKRRAVLFCPATKF
jgi:hypothetical protein